MGQIYLNLGIGSERLEDDVASLTLLGLVFGELSGVHQALHETLIFGELDRFRLSDQIGPAVTDLHEIQVVAVDTRGCHGGSHAADLRMSPGIAINPSVGELD